jgi:hypothetical protein
VEPSHVEDGLALGAWVAERRRAHARGRLSPEDAARLEAIPDWAWSEEQAHWLRGFRMLAAHPPGTPLPPGLQGWADAQRAQHAEGEVPADRRRLLEALPGWTWTVEEAWMHGYELVRAHPSGEPLPPGLRGWVDAQQGLYARGEMPEDWARRLEALPGWRWTFERS